MDWEYMQGCLTGDMYGPRMLSVILPNRTEGRQPQVTMNELGAQGWELVTVVYAEEEFHAFFKRQKLYPVGAAPLEPRF